MATISRLLQDIGLFCRIHVSFVVILCKRDLYFCQRVLACMLALTLAFLLVSMWRYGDEKESESERHSRSPSHLHMQITLAPLLVSIHPTLCNEGYRLPGSIVQALPLAEYLLRLLRLLLVPRLPLWPLTCDRRPQRYPRASKERTYYHQRICTSRVCLPFLFPLFLLEEGLLLGV